MDRGSAGNLIEEYTCVSTLSTVRGCWFKKDENKNSRTGSWLVESVSEGTSMDERITDNK